MKLSKVLLLVACGTALAFLPRRSSRRQTLADDFDTKTLPNKLDNLSNSVSDDLGEKLDIQNSSHQSDNTPSNQQDNQ